MTAPSPVISAKNLRKTFRIYKHPFDRLRQLFRINRKNSYYTDFTALENINFEIQKGRFIGIVGKNGSGKSTLLKILSGELFSTSGHIEVLGSVALLQLGIGFNSELTGEENVRFSAQIMGFPKHEMESVVAKVRDFSEIGDFFERPVKTYSSGMYSRLSFSCAININPEILIADEVLAVGDIRFTQKCLRKMKEIKDQGKTVILVSHDVQAVMSFCDEVIWLKEGQVFMHGPTKLVVEHFKNYMYYDRLPESLESSKAKALFSKSASSWIAVDDALHYVIGPRSVQFTKVKFQSLEKRQIIVCRNGDACSLFIQFRCISVSSNFKVGFVLTDRMGQVVLHLDNEVAGLVLGDLEMGKDYTVQFDFDWPNVNKGLYSLSIGAQKADSRDEIYCRAHDVCEIESVLAPELGEQFGICLFGKSQATLIESHGGSNA